MKRTILVLLVIGALVSAQAAIGQGASSRQDQLLAQLESRAAQLDDQLARTPVPQGKGDSDRALRRAQISQQRQHLRDLIEKIRAGQPVSPEEIEGAF